MLAAALEGPPAFDREMRALEEAGALDESLNGYLEEVAGRLRQVQSVTGGQDSPLLSVISILRDRIKAEKQSAENPRLRTFAQCLATDDRAFRQQLIQADCRSLESLLELYGLVEESVAYVAGEEGAGETPQDVVKAALAEGGDEDARQQTEFVSEVFMGSRSRSSRTSRPSSRRRRRTRTSQRSATEPRGTS